MTTHPDCLNPTACIAKGKNRDGGPPRCHGCMMTARNVSDKQRQAVRAEKLKNPTLTAERIAKGRLPEARAKASHNRREREMSWCPAEYRDFYDSMTKRRNGNERMKAAEVKAIIMDDIAKKEGRAEVVHFMSLGERIDASHERKKRSGSFYGSGVLSKGMF